MAGETNETVHGLITLQRAAGADVYMVDDRSFVWRIWPGESPETFERRIIAEASVLALQRGGAKIRVIPKMRPKTNTTLTKKLQRDAATFAAEIATLDAAGRENRVDAYIAWLREQIITPRGKEAGTEAMLQEMRSEIATHLAFNDQQKFRN